MSIKLVSKAAREREIERTYQPTKYLSSSATFLSSKDDNIYVHLCVCVEKN